MKLPQPDDEQALRRILERQQKRAFDLEKSIDWAPPIALNRYFVPLDHDNVAFPDAKPAQRLVLSQFLGLVVAQTFSEMETALVQAKDLIWKTSLEKFPVNPEFQALGEQFFAEEEKHSRMFRRYLEKFAAQTGVAKADLDSILPTVSGTILQTTLKLNSVYGGHALWWVLTLVEEVSILIFKQIKPFRDKIDPLYFEIHLQHFAEEVRHSPYSYWMLEHLYKRDRSLAGMVFRKTDLALAQALEIVWALSSLTRIRNVARLRAAHPFYATLQDCIPLMRNLSPVEIIRRLFVTAPFISLLLNPKNHDDMQGLITRIRALQIPTPQPAPSPLRADP